jgi:hypothetical protein
MPEEYMGVHLQKEAQVSVFTNKSICAGSSLVRPNCDEYLDLSWFPE